ncbi:MAG: GMC family oxidoreductase [Proteobacteria bacterium]|nr:GMC family oxidoreductase [Pseudomonadota bacterium]
MINDRIQTQIAIVGTGAGGAMVAQELACADKELVIIEQGSDTSRLAGMDEMELGRQLYQENGRFPKSEEGIPYYRALNIGGTTEIAIGSGVRSLEDELKSLGIDLREEFAETEDELGLTPMVEEHIGPNAKLLTGAAESLGMEMTRWPKFIDFERCTYCGKCVITCPTGAKWSAKGVIKKLTTMGNVRLLSETRVKSVNVCNGCATGVVCETNNGSLEVQAEKTILAAGGLGTPVVLRNSGIEAGKALFLDLYTVVYGRSPDFLPNLEPSMPTVFAEHYDRGYVLAPHVDVVLMFQGLKKWFGDRPPYGIMVKTRDSNAGSVDENGRVSKRLTDNDRNRLSTGGELAKKILIQAGVEPETITITGPYGGHPGATAAIGEVVNPNLECRSVKGLYICDGSVLPVSPGLPPILTIASLAKWLGKLLIIDY